MIKKTDKKCEKCNFPLLMSIKKGKKPWIFCFNPNCQTRKNNKIIKSDNENNNRDNSEEG